MVNNSREHVELAELAGLTEQVSGIGAADSGERLVVDAPDYPRSLLRVVRENGPEGLQDLLATIHERVIPQLLLAHHDGRPSSVVVGMPPPTPTAREVEIFAELATRQNVTAAVAFVDQLTARGVSLELILLDLVAPAARLLGAEWETDVRNFSEVTIGLSTLQQVVHVIGPALAGDPATRGSILLVAAPSEQHTLGIHVLGEFLRKAGWGVRVESALPRAEVIRMVETEHLEMVGVSISNGDLVEPLTRLVEGLRRAPLNPDMAVMMGGSLKLSPQEHAAIGATFSTDPHEAVRWLDEHMRALKSKGRSG